MEKFVPDCIHDLVMTIEARRYENRPLYTGFEQDVRARWTGICALRDTREADLKQACGIIAKWLEQFEHTVGPTVWRLAGEGIVFWTGHFWNHEPVPPGEMAYSAQLRFEPPGQAKGRLAYEELKHGCVSVRYWQSDPLKLWHRLHPDVVLHCAAHIQSGRVWNTIHAGLEQLRRP